jgi:stage III sporulation protein AD
VTTTVLQVVAFALVSAVLLVVVRQNRPELAVPLGLAAGALIFIFVAARLAEVIAVIGRVAEAGGTGISYLGVVLRVIGVAYVAEFGAQVCRDAGEGALAAKVELAGKLAVVLLAAPVVVAVLDLVLGMLG